MAKTSVEETFGLVRNHQTWVGARISMVVSRMMFVDKSKKPLSKSRSGAFFMDWEEYMAGSFRFASSRVSFDGYSSDGINLISIKGSIFLVLMQAVL